MKNKINPIIWPAILVFTACSGNKKAAGIAENPMPANRVTLTQEQLKNADILTGKAEVKTLSATLSLNGVIDVPPQNMVSISAPMGGYLKRSQLMPGMPVKKGEIIAIIEDQQYIELQQNYLTTAAKLNMLQLEYERQKALNSSKAGSDKVFEQTEAEYKSQRILFKSLAEKLRFIGINPDALNENNISRSLAIYSPISGFVSKINVNIGKYVNPTDVLFELVNPTDIHLNLKLYEKDINTISIGQKVKTWTNSNPNEKFNCEVILIGRDIGPDRTVEIHCHFDQYDKTLVPGMYMNAEVIVENKSSITVPDAAIIRNANKDYCFAVRANNSFELVEIKKGISQNGFTAIESANGTEINGLIFVLKNAYTIWMQLQKSSENE